jgi:hypothetical protein
LPQDENGEREKERNHAAPWRAAEGTRNPGGSYAETDHGLSGSKSQRETAGHSGSRAGTLAQKRGGRADEIENKQEKSKTGTRTGEDRN